ncbi:hypothetical protein [Mycolicibacterium mucogenicum]|uniref:Uncharacterized protein n=1 Tax=Mycolicibacterium mucogenicum DSM 44124 TaxID=1226753 RepID=A0A8H2PHP6_MYCMU|nr:hypothetical protein [Mycolicibacterium mucogenicum]KAB7755189.1 hypothetical protein MMUC44124_20600 [Mycolicibacterium mucogenicum DSM 44124]QPG68869.1 hypothetical protein C1S78_026210 [Mycolicibacterium mucogenicum DSM 44124]
MAITAGMYGKFGLSLANKEINLNTDTFKFLLTTNAYTIDKDAHQYLSSITNEVVGTGYTAGGVTLSPLTVTYDAANDRVKWVGSNPAWNPLTVTGARRGVFYDDTAPNKPLVSWVDLGQDYNLTAANFSIPWDALGTGYINL